MANRKEKDIIHIKLDLEEGTPHYDMFKKVMNKRGMTIANETVRMLIKEEYDREQRLPLAAGDPIIKEAEAFIKEHPELEFNDVEDFLRSAARLQLLYGQKRQNNP